MQRLIEFAGNHYFLVSAAVLMLVLLIVSEIRARIQDFAALGPQDAVRLMNQGGVVIDVRGTDRYDAGHIGEARSIPQKELASSADSLRKFKDKPVLTYCDTGLSGGAAARELSRLGFSKVFNLRGGLAAWQKENLPLVRGGRKGADKKNSDKSTAKA